MFRTRVTQSAISYLTTRLIVDCILDRFFNIPLKMHWLVQSNSACQKTS
jgi:hypothetical protein